jgi:hypothetical protein
MRELRSIPRGDGGGEKHRRTGHRGAVCPMVLSDCKGYCPGKGRAARPGRVECGGEARRDDDTAFPATPPTVKAKAVPAPRWGWSPHSTGSRRGERSLLSPKGLPGCYEILPHPIAGKGGRPFLRVRRPSRGPIRGAARMARAAKMAIWAIPAIWAIAAVWASAARPGHFCGFIRPNPARLSSRSSSRLAVFGRTTLRTPLRSHGLGLPRRLAGHPSNTDPRTLSIASLPGRKAVQSASRTTGASQGQLRSYTRWTSDLLQWAMENGKWAMGMR